MRIGLAIQSTDLSIGPIELAQEAEDRGFYSLYLPEHTHIPTSRRTPAPTGDAELSQEYLRSLDPYIALAAAAARTEKILLGTGIGLVAQHDPITLAKQIATLDLLSSGRLVLGIGFGPDTQQVIEDVLGDLPNDEIRKITHENAAALFRHPLPEVCLP